MGSRASGCPGRSVGCGGGSCPLPQCWCAPGDMIACVCRDLCLYISAAPSVVYDAVMDFLSQCAGNGGLGSQVFDAQKMIPMLKKQKQKI